MPPDPSASQGPSLGAAVAGDTTPVSTSKWLWVSYQSPFPKRDWEIQPRDSYHDGGQDGNLINPLHVPRTEVPAPEDTSKETPWRNLKSLVRKIAS